MYSRTDTRDSLDRTRLKRACISYVEQVQMVIRDAYVSVQRVKAQLDEQVDHLRERAE